MEAFHAKRSLSSTRETLIPSGGDVVSSESSCEMVISCLEVTRDIGASHLRYALLRGGHGDVCNTDSFPVGPIGSEG